MNHHFDEDVAAERADLLDRIRRVAQRKSLHQDVLKRDAAELRCLIHDGFELGLSGSVLAAASGISLPRTYQLRNEVTSVSMFDAG